MQGEIIDGRWALLRSIGKGGMGEVFVARHTTLETTVALKLLKPELSHDATIREKMITEAKAAVKVRHSNVVLVSDVGQTKEGVVFIVMEYVDGHDLKTLLEREGPLAIDRARSLLGQIASGLAAAHANKVIHRDIKPANCVVAKAADGTEVVKILDFGIAKILEDTIDTAKESPTTNQWFTRHYVAPEIEKGHASDERSDVYSFGVLAYRMLTGHYPYEKTLEAITPPEHYRPDIPCDLCELVRDSLRTDPDDRPSSMSRVCQRLLAPESMEHPSDSFGAGDSLARWNRWVLMPSLLASSILITAFLSQQNPQEHVMAALEPIPTADAIRQVPEHPASARGIHASMESGPLSLPNQTDPVATAPSGSPKKQPSHRSSPIDPDKQAKDMVKRCLTTPIRDRCLGEDRRIAASLGFSFTVRDGEPSGLEVTTADGKEDGCIVRAIRACSTQKLRDGYYEFTINL